MERGGQEPYLSFDVVEVSAQGWPTEDRITPSYMFILQNDCSFSFIIIYCHDAARNFKGFEEFLWIINCYMHELILWWGGK